MFSQITGFGSFVPDRETRMVEKGGSGRAMCTGDFTMLKEIQK
jgi:hypothetical protein